MAAARQRARYITKLDQVEALADQVQDLEPVGDKFAFRTNDYYQSLIDWDDPHDPIRRIVIPDVQELNEFGQWDASDEASYTVVPGLEHKYADTALLLVNNVCGAYCRFCFRKRLFTKENDETTNDIGPALEYLRQHLEINNVLMTGGDPLILSTPRLNKILEQIRQLPHVRIIRIGTKMPAFDPYRITRDPELVTTLGKHSQAARKIYIMAHFNHPRELTKEAVRGLNLLQEAGVMTVNQTPIIRGVNDSVAVLVELFNQLSFHGVPPYYLFLCRPTLGNDPFAVPVEEAWEIFQGAQASLSGLAGKARLCMSHKSGKIEVLGRTSAGQAAGQMIFRYHRAAEPRNHGRIMMFPSNPDARWFDDYLMASS